MVAGWATETVAADFARIPMASRGDRISGEIRYEMCSDSHDVYN
jgi:hypothetical protein